MDRSKLQRTVLLLIFSLSTHLSILAQVRTLCTTDKLSSTQKHTLASQSHFEDISFWQKRLEENTESGETILSIPVVVHVIHNDPALSPNKTQSSHISPEQVFSQIRVLNEDFRKKKNTNGFNTHPRGADVGIEFCLASSDPNGASTNGINIIYNDRKSWNTSSEDEVALKALSYWPSDQYLNIWVTNLEVEKGFGYARYPFGSGLEDFEPDVDYGAELDGIVIDYRVFGTVGAAVYPYNLGRTTTHEVGHWLGLKHIWGDALCGNDFVDDTPMDQSPNNDLDCADSSFCTENYVQDLTSNYLDFSPDKCMNLFTIGQVERMLHSLLNSPRRRALFESQGCSGINQKLYANVFPNPASDILSIELFWPGHQSVVAEWFNSQGACIFATNLETIKATTYQIDVSKWPEGIYFLKIRNSENKAKEARKVVRILITR